LAKFPTSIAMDWHNSGMEQAAIYKVAYWDHIMKKQRTLLLLFPRYLDSQANLRAQMMNNSQVQYEVVSK